MQIRGTGGLPYSDSSGKFLKKTNRELQKILEKLSTAVRINTASDDAAGLAVSEELRTQIRGFKIAGQNSAHAESALNIASEGSNQITSLLQRQRELALAAHNDTLTSTDRENLNREYQALTQEVSRITSNTRYNNLQLLSGTDLGSGNAVIQSGAQENDSITLPHIDITGVASTLQSTSLLNSQSASSALTALEESLNSVISFQSTIGSTQNRLSSVQNNLLLAEINTQAAESVLRDQDMAEGLAELTRKQLLNEGATRAFSRFNEMNRNLVMGLLQ
jgi:flagellin